MTIPKNLGMILLAIWLIVHGLMTLLSLSFQGSNYVMSILALVAGILLLLGR